MPLELLTIKDLNDFKAELIRELKQLLSNNPPVTPKGLLKTREVLAILRISPGTLQNLRRNQTLECRKIGGTLYYYHEDIHRLTRKI
jgi:hypothetical protein